MNILSDPIEIEKRSFEIISESLGDRPLGPNAPIVKRVIHTTADFDYLDNLVFSENVLGNTVDALKRGGFHVVTDTRMAEAGINKRAVAKLKGTTHCYIDSGEVAREAKAAGATRSRVCMEYAARRLTGPTVYVIGNAPTALLRLCELIEEGACRPMLVVGVPVGFVNVVESKEMILELDVPFIVARGRKGGSNVAAAILNALMYEAGAR